MEYVKKYWFVILVAVLFTVAIGYFAIENGKDTSFHGKQVNGQDVVFEYNGTDVTADELYEEQFDNYAPALALQFIQSGVYRSAFDPSEDLLNEANTYYDNTIANYKAYYGESYEKTLLQDLYSLGYTKIEDLKEYYITSLMAEQLRKEYMEAHKDELYSAYAEAKSPRILSHILVKMEDVNNPTEEELAKVKAVEDALAAGRSFEDVAKEFSDDTGSAANGGKLGFSDADTSYVTEFLEAALKLNAGETTSEWVIHDGSASGGYSGYHLIRCDSTSYEDFKDDETFLTNWETYSNIDRDVFVEAYNKAEIDYHGNESIQKFVEDALKEEEGE